MQGWPCHGRSQRRIHRGHRVGVRDEGEVRNRRGSDVSFGADHAGQVAVAGWRGHGPLDAAQIKNLDRGLADRHQVLLVGVAQDLVEEHIPKAAVADFRHHGAGLPLAQAFRQGAHRIDLHLPLARVTLRIRLLADPLDQVRHHIADQAHRNEPPIRRSVSPSAGW